GSALHVRGAAHRSLDLIDHARVDAARGERQWGAEEELTRPARAAGAARTLDRRVVRAPMRIDVAGIGRQVLDRTADGARPARTHLGGTVEREGQLAVRHDRRVVTETRPAAVEDLVR